MAIKTNWDVFGIVTSVACAIHCALLPLITTTLPLFGFNIIHNAVFEWGMIALAFFVGAYSLFHGFIKHHRNMVPFFLFSGGVCFLVLKQLFPAAEYLFLAFAVCLIITAHIVNYRFCKHSKSCDSPHHVH